MCTSQLYKKGNKWQRLVYKHMSAYLLNKGVTQFGKSERGTASYTHILKLEDAENNFLNSEIHKAVLNRFAQHKAGDLNRVLTNSVSSQTYCFNLFVPLQQNLKLASELFSKLLEKEIDVKHIEIEFTPNTLDSLFEFERNGKNESIGDQNDFSGTDADIAVFFKNSNGGKGVILIEFKFIESKFSTCTSYTHKIGNRPTCNSSRYWNSMVVNKMKDKNDHYKCGYNKFQNWQLTIESDHFDINKFKKSYNCPFRFSLNQLWRNMLLAEKVAEVRQLSESHFWVFSPTSNTYLWNNNNENIEKRFRSLLTYSSKRNFRLFSLGSFISSLDSFSLNSSDKTWLSNLKERYIIAKTKNQ